MNNDSNQTVVQQQAKTQGTPKRKPYWPFIFYTFPLIITMIIGVSTQLSIRDACLALPVESQGECGVGWLQIFVIPVTYIALFALWILVLAGNPSLR